MSETISEYQQEQLETLEMVRRYFSQSGASCREAFTETASRYLAFRKELNGFLGLYFATACTRKCFQSRLSACCSREGIITFFADVVINALISTEAQLDLLTSILQRPNRGVKCIYLGDEGCLWQLKPIVCERFLCDAAQNDVFKQFPQARQVWEALKQREKQYTWPDRPVLFDDIERRFMDDGLISPLMYLHNSPGLLRVKRLSGL